MKFTTSVKRKSGMTLLELTVVILVLLSLISILFVGARAWKKGSDRAANIMNIRNCNQAVRGYQNMYGKVATDPFLVADLIQYVKLPTPPAAGITYAPTLVIGGPGALWLGPGGDGAVDADMGPTLASTSDW
jgi:prepilin-type N-terminal cleavage/methylation domain-containing protein